ncbi:hypothetical protein [Thermodesulfatator atlanticus]|uniref:hypothetical protein n=1 Tax=Thermodesulfatator atlanticus TaxID=501497 RepID=UPI0003B5F534|nr:hypothetical protein [Thermodesulfatator atlanticus]
MKNWPKLGVLLVVLFLVASCTLPGQERPKTTPQVQRPLYTGTEFPNIVAPRDMSVDQEKTMIVRTKNYIGGVLVLKGRVKARSLERFFKDQLASRGWELTGSIYYKNILLTFKRANGFCMVYIVDHPMTTEAQIWASETLEDVSYQ